MKHNITLTFTIEATSRHNACLAAEAFIDAAVQVLLPDAATLTMGPTQLDLPFDYEHCRND